MAFYMDEEQAWKCPKHPSKRRRSTGICAKCLRERLVTLFPDCAGDRPCGCCPAPVDSSSSSSTSSSSFSLFSFSRGGSRRDSATGAVDSGRLSNNLEADPTLRKSRSVAVSFLRSRSRYVGNGTGTGGGGDGCDTAVVTEDNKASLPKVSRSKINFWSVFTVNKSKKCDAHGDDVVDELNNKSDDLTTVDDNPVMMRSRSVAVGAGNGFAPATAPATAKQKGWYFPSPIKGFRHSKPPRSVAVA